MNYHIVDYFRSEITTGISIESQPSGLYSESSSPAYQTHGQTIRSRVETRPKSENHGNNQHKRLSLVSSESAGTSGIHDMSTENDLIKTESRSPTSSLKGSNSFSFPRKPYYPRNDSESRIANSNTANALVDMPFRQARVQDNDPETNFVRNTIKRRTLHVDFAMEELDALGRRQLGHTTSSPIPSATQPHLSPPKTLDEVDEESECCDDVSNRVEVDGDSSSTRRFHSISVTSLPTSPGSPVFPMQASTPCLASTSSQAAASNSSESPKFTFKSKDKGKEPKEKDKKKTKKVIFHKVFSLVVYFR